MKYYYFTAGWCSPCKAMKPLVEKISKIEIIDVDTDEGATLAGRFSVRGIPMLVAYDEVNDKMMDQMIGAHPATVLDKFMEKNK